MSKKRSRVGDYLVYLVLRVLICIAHVLSYRCSKSLARFMAWILYHVDRRHRLVALDNLMHAYGDELTDAQRDKIVREVYVHFCTLMLEILHLPRRMHVQNWKDYMELINGDVTVNCLLSDRPLFIVTGHLGNWEIAGFALGLFGFKTHAIARPIDNPYLDRFLRGFRERTGQRIIAKTGEFELIQQVLDEGGVIATLADQDAGKRGQFAEFFGRPASTHKAVALLALEYNVPMLVTGNPRLENVEVHGRQCGSPERYYVVAEELIDPAEYDDRLDAIPAITQRYVSAFERVVRLAPEQYFWLHRRWKTQPGARRKRKAG